jgi:hypothetical protein
VEFLRELLFCPEHGLLVLCLRYQGVVLTGAASALSGGVLCRARLIGFVHAAVVYARSVVRSVAGM